MLTRGVKPRPSVTMPRAPRSSRAGIFHALGIPRRKPQITYRGQQRRVRRHRPAFELLYEVDLHELYSFEGADAANQSLSALSRYRA